MNRFSGPTSCPACLSPGRPTRLVVDGRYRLVRCGSCRSEYFRADAPAGADAGEVSHYWEQYKFAVYADPQVQSDYERRYAGMLTRARGLTSSLDSVLDVGCGIGNFLAFAEDRGLRAYGVDIEPDAVEAATARGLKVALSDRLDTVVDAGSVDALTLWDVIEHLYEPDPVLARSLSRLRPGGVVLLETPDARFWVRRVVLLLHTLTRARLDLTEYLYYWEHKIYFSEAGLRAILGRMGAEVVDVRRDTSPKEKMQGIFEEDAARSWRSRVLARLWPALELVSRRAHRGNKLLVTAVLADPTFRVRSQDVAGSHPWR